MVAAMNMTLAQRRAACLAKPSNAGSKQLASFRAARTVQRGMAVVKAATAAVAPPATGDIKDKNAELAINGKMWEMALTMRHPLFSRRPICAFNIPVITLNTY